MEGTPQRKNSHGQGSVGTPSRLPRTPSGRTVTPRTSGSTTPEVRSPSQSIETNPDGTQMSRIPVLRQRKESDKSDRSVRPSSGAASNTPEANKSDAGRTGGGSSPLLMESARRRLELAAQLEQMDLDDSDEEDDVETEPGTLPDTPKAGTGSPEQEARPIALNHTERRESINSPGFRAIMARSDSSRDHVSSDFIPAEIPVLEKAPTEKELVATAARTTSPDAADLVASSPVTPPITVGSITSTPPHGRARALSTEDRERKNSGQSMLEKEEGLRNSVRELRRLVDSSDFVDASMLLHKMASDGTDTPLQNFVDFAACLLDREDSDYHVLLNCIGKIYTAKKDYDTALLFLNELASAQETEDVTLDTILSPEDSVVTTLCNIAAVLDELGKYDEALSCYERAQVYLEKCHAEACQRNSNNHATTVNTAASEKLAGVLHAIVVINCLKMHRPFTDYKLPMERLLSIPSADFHDSLASMFETKGMIVQAEYVLTSSVRAVGGSLGEMHPQKVKLLMRRGDIRLEVRFFEGARKDYEEAADLAASTQHKHLEGPCRTRLAFLYYLMGNTADAESQCYSALLLSQDANDPVTEAEGSMVLAQIKYKNGDMKGYHRHMQFCLITLEAMCQEKNTNVNKARSSYARALEISAEIHEEQKEFKESLHDLEAALSALVGIGRYREAVVEKKLGKLLTQSRLRDSMTAEEGLAYLSSALPVFQDLIRGSEGCDSAIGTYAEVLGHRMVGHTFALIGECAVLEKDAEGAKCAFEEARQQLAGIRDDEMLHSVEKRLKDIESGKGCCLM